MPTFNCKVVALSGGTKIRQVEALSEAEAKATLNNCGEIVLHVKQARSAGSEPIKAAGRSKVSADEVAGAVRQMSIMIAAGVPLVEGLRSLAEQTKSRMLQSCLEEIATEISQGESLSACFGKHQDIFPKLAADMAKVAEAGGNLAEAMARLAEHMEGAADISRRIRSALAYPIAVVCISFVTVIVLMTFVLPRFMKLFGALGAKVPLPTKILMSISHTLTSDWYVWLFGALTVVYLTKKYVRSARGRRKIDALLLRLPIIGDIASKIAIGRVVASMATLISSGVSMIQALEISASAADNNIVETALLKARQMVAEGKATSQALKSTGVFPPVVLQMVTSGEKTGELPTMLDHICRLYRQETDAKVKSLISVIEPILIVLLGIVVGSIAVSVILPIYSLVGSVH